MKKYIALAVSLMMTLGCAQMAFAEVIRWNLSDGDLEIKESNVNPDGYEVTSDGTTSNVIVVSDGVKTYIVLKDVEISSSNSGIKIGDGAEVNLELKGENSIYTSYYDYSHAGINVADGKLIIDGTGSIDIETDGDGAGIGSDDYEDFTGVIIINGGTVTAESGDDGAGIGAGDEGDMSGSITINGGTVTAKSGDDGAGIGAGDDGNMSGSITINGGTVTAESNSDGSGIGSGNDGNMSGSITINGGTVTAESDDDGAGIGAGDDGVMSGSITINGGTVTAESDYDGSGIGSGNDGDMSGSITINGGTVTAVSGDDGAGIGSGDDGVMSGSITINGGTVTAKSDEDGAGIGAGCYGNITETGKIHIGGDSVVDIYSADGLGIGSGDYGNMNGTIIITDNADVKIKMGNSSNPTAIGSGSDCDNDPDEVERYFMNGSIQILENANISIECTKEDRETIPNIGSSSSKSTGGIVLSTGATINGISGSDIDKLIELGLIGGVNTENIVSVEPTPKSNAATYELKALSLTQRIKKAQPGDTVTISEKQLDKGKLPAYAMEALAEADGISLMIVCDDLAVIIRSDEAVADCGNKMFYTIDELVKMYE